MAAPPDGETRPRPPAAEPPDSGSPPSAKARLGTRPSDQRAAADRAIRMSGWDGPFCVDADHIGLATVDRSPPTATSSPST